MRKLLRTALTLMLLLGFCTSSFAQSWRWGVRGGADDDSHTYGFVDNVIDMATDQNNNIYVLSGVGQGGIDIDGHSKSGIGANGVVISSFKCDGSYRWSKVINCTQATDGAAIRIDTFGGVYVCGYIALTDFAPDGHIDVDSALPVRTWKSMFLLKYDTAGTYKWWVMPEPDTTSFYSFREGSVRDMTVDANGNVDMLTYLNPGAYIHGALIIDTAGVYILKYNASGSYIGDLPLNIGGDEDGFTNLRMSKDSRHGRYYFAGSMNGGGLSIGGTVITHSMFVSTFKTDGTFLWLRQNTFLEGAGGFGSRAAIDTEGSIYLAGGSGTGDTFNTYPIVTSFYASHFAVKIDSNGTNVWAHSSINYAAEPPTAEGIAIGNGKAALIGSYGGPLSWPGSTDSLGTSTEYDVFITTFDASTGAIVGIARIGSDAGEDEYPSTIVADTKGNFYAGGQFQSKMYVGSDTIMSVGGDYDFFVAKYGYDNCTCVTPVASFSATYSDPVNFTYTGSAADSVVWNFGDGSRDTGTSVSHLYAVGTYYACVTAYTSCGSNTYCDTVLAPEGVSNVAMASGVAVYPNPANSEITVEHAQNCEAIIYNIVGVEQYRTHISSNKEQLNVAQLQAGTYILQISAVDGSKESVRIVKE